MKEGILISIESASKRKIKIAEKIEEGLRKQYECQLILNKNYLDSEDAKLNMLNDLACKRNILINSIIPAINKGKLILVDGFIHDSIAKASFYNNIDIKSSYNLTNFMLEKIIPDITFVLTGFDIENGDQFRYQYGLMEMHNNQDKFGHIKVIASQDEETIVKEAISYINTFIFTQKLKGSY